MTSWAISSVFRIISDLDVYRDGRSLSSDAIDAWCLSLELVFRELIVQQTFDRSDQDIDEACEIIRRVVNNIPQICIAIVHRVLECNERFIKFTLIYSSAESVIFMKIFKHVRYTMYNLILHAHNKKKVYYRKQNWWLILKAKWVSLRY